MHTRRRKASESEPFSIVVDDQSPTVPPHTHYTEKEKYPSSWKFQLGQQFQQFSNKVTSVVAPLPQQFLGSSPTAQPPPPHSSTSFSSTVPPQYPTFSSSVLAEYMPPPPRLDDSGDEETTVRFVGAQRDRSQEFMSAIRLLQSKNLQRMVRPREQKKITTTESYIEFLNIAKLVERNCASTRVKLKKLKLLVKQKSLFDDRTAEIDQLTHIIKTDLASLNQQIARLQDVSKHQTTTTIGANQLQKHSMNIVVGLQTRLAGISTTFKVVLEVRTAKLKEQKQRREEYSASQMGQSSNWSGTHPSLLLEEEAAAGGAYGGDMQPLIPRGQQMMTHHDQSHYQERAESMKTIESTIVELGGIFQQLATLVKEQEEMVDRIDTNVLDMEMNVDMAHTEILKYFQSVTKNRALMIKIFIVIVIFFLFFYFFLA